MWTMGSQKKSRSTMAGRPSPLMKRHSPSLISNVLMGVVISKTEGLTRTTLRIRVGEHTDLRVRWQAPCPTRGTANIGQRVCVTIPEEAVHLEAGGFRRGKQRWNRWIGRVVLVNRNDEDPVTTVKLHWESITLKSVGPVLGARTALSVWDTVNIVVDPQQVRLVPVRRPCSQVMPSGMIARPLRSSLTNGCVWGYLVVPSTLLPRLRT